MKISIQNFKSIRALDNYELKPLTILSGVNSTGKSSFIQLFLLLKQTLELDSARNQLYLDGDWYQVGSYRDIITDKKPENNLYVAFTFSKEEDLAASSDKRITIFDSFKSYEIKVEARFDIYQGSIFIKEFKVSYELPDVEKGEQFISFQTQRGKKDTYHIDTNSALFADRIWTEFPQVTGINYSSIFPTYYEVLEVSTVEGARKGQKLRERKTTKLFPNLDGVKNLCQNMFSSISYIGPIREQPKDEYTQTTLKTHVGKFGEYTAQVLENFKNVKVDFREPTFSEDGITYQKKTVTLLQAVKYWMCDVFKIGRNIYSKKKGDAFVIFLENNAGIETTIKHVGFGISQILPVIVQGLLISKGGTLILEQPEIHLHPKVQSLLFDFLYSLILQDKSVMIETHSDHFITRMRRRVAEDKSNLITQHINLTFIEPNDRDIYFEILEVDDMGTMDYFPSDFIEQSGNELKSILRAQMKKRSQ